MIFSEKKDLFTNLFFCFLSFSREKKEFYTGWVSRISNINSLIARKNGNPAGVRLCLVTIVIPSPPYAERRKRSESLQDI